MNKPKWQISWPALIIILAADLIYLASQVVYQQMSNAEEKNDIRYQWGRLAENYTRVHRDMKHFAMELKKLTDQFDVKKTP